MQVFGLQAVFLCKLRAVSADGAPLGTRFDRLYAVPPDSSYRAFFGNSVKIVLDFTGVSRLSGNNSVIPFLTAAKKRHFHPPKLPALRAEVDGRTQKSVRPFSCFAACGFSLCRNSLADVLFLLLAFLQHSRTLAQRPVFWCLAGTRSVGLRKPHKPPTRA